MIAVILAAGMGKRLRDQHALPKGLLKLGEKSIIEESIAKLLRAGIERILIVTGYGADYYNQIAADNPCVFTVNNSDYQQSGSLYSLYCAKDWLDDDFLLLESDLLYDPQAISQLMSDAHGDAILVSGWTHSGDEIYVEHNDFNLVKMSKNKSELTQQALIGEFVGISKVTLASFQYMLNRLQENHDILHQGEYEVAGLVKLAQHIPLHCLKINDLLWCEIDNAEHLQRAHSLYQQLNKREYQHE